MGLALTTVYTWTTKRPDKPLKIAEDSYFLLNTNRMSDIKAFTHGGARSQFLFSQAPDDRRCSPDTISAYATVATLAGYHDSVPASKFAILPIFPAFDTTEATVSTMVEWKDIAYVYQTYQDFWVDGLVSHAVIYENGWKRKTVLVDLSLLEFILAEQFGVYL